MSHSTIQRFDGLLSFIARKVELVATSVKVDTTSLRFVPPASPSYPGQVPTEARRPAGCGPHVECGPNNLNPPVSHRTLMNTNNKHAQACA